jgi:thymidine kinase
VKKTPDRNTTDSYNSVVLAAAARVSSGAIRDLLAIAGQRRAIIVAAPAGAGKTGFVIDAVRQCRRRKLRVAVATPTNQQAFELVRRLAERQKAEIVTFVPASHVTLPEETASLENVRQVKAANANTASVIVGTLSKLGDAFSRGSLAIVDVLLIDEAYQADSARYYAVAGLAPTHMLVGDSGQLNPFSTIANADRWRGLPEDPLQTAVGVLLRNHPATVVHRLPLSRRLDTRAVPVVQSFYQDLAFDAAVVSGTRALRLISAMPNDATSKTLDQVLDHAASSGWAHVELPAAPVLIADPQMIDLICSLVERLGVRHPQVRCELQPDWKPLSLQRVAIGVSHNDQKDLLRARLDSYGHTQVVVETANKLQGLEFDFTIAWHPLAGLPDLDPFHLDPGRLCVLLTRHRHACVVVGRAMDRTLLQGIPPKTPAYLGWDPDPVLDGWDVHQAVFGALDPFRIAA